jgi:hypothetical protein
MKLSEHFSITEMTKSQTGERKGIDNTPTDEEVENLKALCVNVLEKIRAHFGKPITVNSGFRGAKLNKAIGGFNKINPFKDIPTIPLISVPIKLAKGGVIPATPGGMLATIGEAGRPERVEPLDPDGLSKRDRAMIAMLAGPAGGINITVNPSPGMDERELAALVSRQLAFQLRRGAA